MNNPPIDLSRLIRAVELQRVRLVETAAKTAISSPGEVGDQTVCVIHASAKAEDSPKKQNSFLVIATVGIELSAPDKVKEPAVSITAAFELEYSLPKGFSAQPEELQGFAEINGAFNVWPYWREYVQNVFSRMNLPPITLPLYRLGGRAGLSISGKTRKPAKKSRKALSSSSV